MNLKDSVRAMAIRQAIKYLEKDPANNIPKIVDWIGRFDITGQLDKHMKAIKPVLKDPESNWNKLLLSIYTDIDQGVRMKLFENFVINASILGGER